MVADLPTDEEPLDIDAVLPVLLLVPMPLRIVVFPEFIAGRLSLGPLTV